MEIRKLHKPEYEAALALVWEVFLEYEAPEYSKEGVDEFLGVFMMKPMCPCFPCTERLMKMNLWE